MITVTATARCHRCDWTAAGDWAATDRAAERHTRDYRHPTATMARPEGNLTMAAIRIDRLAEIKSRQYPNGNAIQIIADFEWLIDEVEYLRESRADWRDMTLRPQRPAQP